MPDVFVVKDKYELDWVVNLNGTDVEIRYVLMTGDEIDQARAGMVTDLDMVKAHVIGWGAQIVDEDGKPLPFSVEVLESLCRKHPFIERRLAIELVRASADGVAKNLTSGSAG